MHTVGSQPRQGAGNGGQRIAGPGGQGDVVGYRDRAVDIGDGDGDGLQVETAAVVFDGDLEGVGRAVARVQGGDGRIARIDGISQPAVGIGDHVALVAVAGPFLDRFGAFRRVFEGLKGCFINGLVDQLGQQIGAGGQHVAGGGDRFGLFRGRGCLRGGRGGLLGGQVGLRRAVLEGLGGFAGLGCALDRGGRRIGGGLGRVGVLDRLLELRDHGRVDGAGRDKGVQGGDRLCLQAIDGLRRGNGPGLCRQHDGRIGGVQGALGGGRGLIGCVGSLHRQIQHRQQFRRQIGLG